MSPDRPTRGKGKRKGADARASGLAPIQRFGLLAFGLAVVLLFVIFAAAVGLGDPDVPDDAVAVVEELPDDLGTITKEEYDHAFEQASASLGLKKPPKPTGKEKAKYEEVKNGAMSSLLDTAWIRGEAEELGISVTDKEIEDKLGEIKEQNFKSEAEYKKFLATSRFTEEDVNERVELQLLSTQIQEDVTTEAGKPSSSEIEEFYDAAKSTQFTTKETRDVRLVQNKDRAKVEEAKQLLEKDSSETSWKEVASKFSTDDVTKRTGGLSPALAEGSLEEPLSAAVFSAQRGQIGGPIETSRGFYVFEVEKVTPEKVQSLKEARPQIESQLTQQTQQEAFSDFVSDWTTKWQSRTFCADDYVVERCSNFEGSSHSPSAPPGCYEEDPKEGLPDACPAPVQQPAPALPGSSTPLTPQGERLPQRPNPGEQEEEAGGEVPGGLQLTP